MLKRILAFSGIPVFTGFLLFPFFYFLKVGYFPQGHSQAAGLEMLTFSACLAPQLSHAALNMHCLLHAGDTTC